ncbi:ROK family transcriptional regulator [bacterium]|nr:ROK family transcriptional regulator [bacterium]
MSTHPGNDAASPSLESEYIAEVLSAVENRAGESRASIARLLGLSRTTSSKIVSQLIDLKLLVEKNLLREGRGRPGMLLDLDTSTWRAIGAEYHSGRWTFVETDLKGNILRTSSLKVARGADPDTFLDGLAKGLGEFSANATGELLPTFGVGAPGLVDCDRGVILRADDLGWKNVRVAEFVKKKLGAKVLLINRNRGAGLAEARFGAGRGVHQMVYIGIGTGISAAFMIDGKLVHGSLYSAGEIGHIAMDTQGPVCGCGKRGCLHVYASGWAIARRAAALMEQGRESSLAAGGKRSEPLTGEEVCVAAAAGDGLALECVQDAAAKLGLAVANIITTFNPDKVVIGGPIGLINGPLLDTLRAEAERWTMPHAFQAAKIERGALGESVGAIGGACLVLDRKLSLVASVRGR